MANGAEEARKLFNAQIRAAVSLTDEFLLCRLVGHMWQRIVPDRAPPFGRIVVWECFRCESKRDDIVQSNDGSLLARTYRYSEGYLIPRPTGVKRQGGRQVSAGALRIALLRRDDKADAEAASR